MIKKAARTRHKLGTIMWMGTIEALIAETGSAKLADLQRIFQASDLATRNRLSEYLGLDNQVTGSTSIIRPIAGYKRKILMDSADTAHWLGMVETLLGSR